MIHNLNLLKIELIIKVFYSITLFLCWFHLSILFVVKGDKKKSMKWSGEDERERDWVRKEGSKREEVGTYVYMTRFILPFSVCRLLKISLLFNKDAYALSTEISESFNNSTDKSICFRFVPSLPSPQALVLNFLWCVLLQPSVFLLL